MLKSIFNKMLEARSHEALNAEETGGHRLRGRGTPVPLVYSHSVISPSSKY